MGTLDGTLVRVPRGCLEPDERGVVRRAFGDEQAMDPVVVTPRGRTIARALAGDEPDDVGEELAERGRVGHFETEVSEFEIDVHARWRRRHPYSSTVPLPGPVVDLLTNTLETTARHLEAIASQDDAEPSALDTTAG